MWLNSRFKCELRYGCVNAVAMTLSKKKEITNHLFWDNEFHDGVCRQFRDLSTKTGIYTRSSFNNPVKFWLLYSVAMRSRMCFWCRSWEVDPAISSAVNGYDGSVEIICISKFTVWKHAQSLRLIIGGIRNSRPCRFVMALLCRGWLR